jgi:hypothetical protein
MRAASGTVPAVSSQRIELEPEEVAGLIRGARLLELRVDTPPDVRRRWTETALTAMDALCGLAERRGTDAVWDALALVSNRELLAFSTLMASELAESGFVLPPPLEPEEERRPATGEPVGDPGRPEGWIDPRGT